MIQERLFEQSNFDRRNQTHEEPDREFRLSDRIALQNLFIDGLIWSAESHIPIRGVVSMGRCNTWSKPSCRSLGS
jgi:hypothetical protein